MKPQLVKNHSLVFGSSLQSCNYFPRPVFCLVFVIL